ncbi:MAG: putative zinc-binding protein [Candidatus Bathyarchaeia archaeon]
MTDVIILACSGLSVKGEVARRCAYKFLSAKGYKSLCFTSLCAGMEGQVERFRNAKIIFEIAGCERRCVSVLLKKLLKANPSDFVCATHLISKVLLRKKLEEVSPEDLDRLALKLAKIVDKRLRSLDTS